MNTRRNPFLSALSLLGLSALFFTLGCGDRGPERVARIRAQYEARLNGFVVRDLPAEGETPARQEILLDILVRRDGRDSLDGLTLDLSVAGSGGAEKARRRLWVDTSGIDKGVEVQVTATVADLDYQPGDGFHVEVRHPIPVAERGDYREFGANPWSSAHPAPGAGPASAGGDLAALTALVHRLEENVARVVRGKPEAIRLAFVCLLARGHVLIEDVPGVGKTTLAQALARSLGLQFQRIQFTSDLLPSDIIGVSVFHQRREAFEFVPGPLFANVVLADEINRATPKTQSALLEAMSERRVSVERQRLPLPEPFLVLATQNPNEYIGTFPLPESQLDRFEMSLRLGYPPRADERELLLSGGVERALATLAPVFGPEELLALMARVDTVRLDEKLVDYVLTLAEATRRGEEFQLGVSTRAAQGLCRAAQALALCEGREYTIPDDIQRLVVPVLGHRVVLRRGSGGGDAARRALEQLVTAVPVPV